MVAHVRFSGLAIFRAMTFDHLTATDPSTHPSHVYPMWFQWLDTRACDRNEGPTKQESALPRCHAKGFRIHKVGLLAAVPSIFLDFVSVDG